MSQATEREAFEAWVNKQPEAQGMRKRWWCRQIDDGGYSCHEPDVMWRAWQARAALASQQAVKEEAMTTEQEALRLADLLQDEAGVDGYVHDEAAAMLRKLVAEREADRAAMRRAVEAWDTTVLPVANDGCMQEAMEIVRQRLEGTT